MIIFGRTLLKFQSNDPLFKILGLPLRPIQPPLTEPPRPTTDTLWEIDNTFSEGPTDHGDPRVLLNLESSLMS